jgi:nucleoside-diphosphate-sugar epimerase
MKILVGDTGLVGTTLKEKTNFDLTFNSKNINKLGDVKGDNIVIYLSCLPATKWMVNKNIKSDIDNINLILENLSKIDYQRIILISTIDVYCDSPIFSNESTPINVKNLSYGTNRYFFELLVKNVLTYKDLKIFRLPALFNKHIKKNILFDLLNNNNISQINKNSSFQWYNLDDLNDDIEYYISKHPNENVFNLFTEPIDTCEVIKLFPEHENNVTSLENRVEYNFTTKHTLNGYIKSKHSVLNDIKKFINEFSDK